LKGDWLVISVLAIAFAFGMAIAGADVVLGMLHIISRWFMALPSPTEEWAHIVSALAWPLVLAFFLVRYRGYLRRFLDTVAERLKTDKVKLGPFELTPNSEVIALDPEDAAESTETYAPEDIERIERLFEFITEPGEFRKLADWVAQNVDPKLDIGSFLTEPPYATQREQAYQALVVRRGGQK
jgi:hypothetical protein